VHGILCQACACTSYRGSITVDRMTAIVRRRLL